MSIVTTFILINTALIGTVMCVLLLLESWLDRKLK